MVPLAVPCLGGESLGVSAHSANPEKAQRFVAYLLEEDQQRRFAIQAQRPPARAVLYAQPDLATQQPALEVWSEALSRARLRPTSSRYGQISEVIYSEVHSMLLGSQSVEDTSAAIQARLEALVVD
jgi:multiple sugar transport system substrate-binding protein